jgi:predicted methyltransferase
VTGGFDIGLSRRRLVLAGAGLALAGCGKGKPKAPAEPKAKVTAGTIAWAVAGPWRAAEDRARDPARHPAESLAFWGLKPGATVVEFWPGAGWYTDIIAPFLASTGGKFYAANLQAGDPGEPAAIQVVEAYRTKLAADRKLYGEPVITAFGPTTGAAAPAASADLVLFLRNLHNWMAAGIADKAFKDAYAALKPGGVLGIEEHRQPSGGVQDVLAANGYVQEAYVRRLAQDAGFRFDKASEINANPKDTHDHPFGVWTLPPVRASSPRGKPPNPAFDHAKYDAIGESDRMTLRFTKPA